MRALCCVLKEKKKKTESEKTETRRSRGKKKQLQKKTMTSKPLSLPSLNCKPPIPDFKLTDAGRRPQRDPCHVHKNAIKDTRETKVKDARRRRKKMLEMGEFFSG